MAVGLVVSLIIFSALRLQAGGHRRTYDREVRDAQVALPRYTKKLSKSLQ